MAGSIAWTCSKVFPHCAFTLTAAVNETNLPLVFAHLQAEHTPQGNPNPSATMNDAVTYS